MARYFRSTPHTLFEIFNEPAGITADAWQPVAAELVRTIRAEGASQLVIVGGVDFASDVSMGRRHPHCQRQHRLCRTYVPGDE